MTSIYKIGTVQYLAVTCTTFVFRYAGILTEPTKGVKI